MTDTATQFPLTLEAVLRRIEGGEGEALSLQTLIDTLFDLREVIRTRDAETNTLKSAKTDLEVYLLSRLDEQGLERMGTDVANISVSTEVVPTTHDWEALFNYIRDNDAFYLLQRRMNAGAYRELAASLPEGESLPGVEPFTKKKLNMRKV